MADILIEKGAPRVVLADLTRDDMASAIDQAFCLSATILAASSYDANVFPPMYDFLHHLQLKNFQKRRIGLIENGSWAPTAGKVMRTMVEQMKDMEIVDPMITIRSRMKQPDILALETLADAILAK